MVILEPRYQCILALVEGDHLQAEMGVHLPSLYRFFPCVHCQQRHQLVPSLSI